MSNKLFIGNIPFYCHKHELEKCFNNLDGYVKCELILRNNSIMNKGYGNVTFKNNYFAKQAYNKCLNNQRFLKQKYMNKEYLRSYILGKI